MKAPDTLDMIVNLDATEVLRSGESTVIRNIRDVLPRLDKVISAPGKAFAEAVKNWTLQNPDGKKGLLIGGGDGSFSTAIGQTLGTNIAIGHEPLGNFCFDAKSLGATGDYIEAARKYNDIEVAQIDVTQANGKNILIGALFGETAVQVHEIIEAVRKRKIFTAAAKAASILSRLPKNKEVRLSVTNENTGLTEIYSGKAILLSNNLVNPQPVTAEKLTLRNLFNETTMKTVAVQAVEKKEMDGGQLGIYAWNGDKAMFSRFAHGDWPWHPSIDSDQARAFTVTDADPKVKKMTIVLDGEITEMDTPIRFVNRHKALKVLKPVRR